MKELWEDWDEGVDLYNCNVPLGFRGPDNNPVQPQCLRTSVDPLSYASLYGERPSYLSSWALICMSVLCTARRWLLAVV